MKKQVPSVWSTRARKGARNIHMLLNVGLMILLWIMINYLGVRHRFREDWSRQPVAELSPLTENVLKGLEAPVEIFSLISREFRAGDELDDLLSEVDRRSDLVTVTRVDPERDLGQTKALRTEYDLQQPNRLILVSRDRHVVVNPESAIVMESDEERELGREPRMTGFRGEALLTGSLVELTRRERPVVYFLTGHGEKEIDNFENDPQAYSDVRERLEGDFIDVRTLDLEREREVPEDADAVIVAGPRTRIAQPEIDLLRRYLNRDGRMMVLVDVKQDAGLVPFLKEFGIQLLTDMVVDPQRTLRGPDVHITEYARHPITSSMDSIRTIFIRPRSVLPAEQGEVDMADRPQYTPLAATSPAGWAELTLDENPVRFEPGVDQKGPIPVAAAVEWMLVGEGGNAMPGRRLVVVGDSVFAGNWLQNGGGQRFMVNAVNWLLHREDLIEIPPRDVTEIQLRMDRAGLNRLLLEVAVMLPVLAAAFGGWVFWRRRG